MFLLRRPSRRALTSEPSTQLLRNGDVLCVYVNQKELGEAHILLFNDVLYITKRSGGRARDAYKLKHVVRLATALVNEARIKRHPFAFELSDVENKIKYAIAFEEVRLSLLVSLCRAALVGSTAPTTALAVGGEDFVDDRVRVELPEAQRQIKSAPLCHISVSRSRSRALTRREKSHRLRATAMVTDFFECLRRVQRDRSTKEKVSRCTLHSVQ